MADYKNRITGHGNEPLDGILFNPRNWRIHPGNQQRALEGVLDTVGFVQDVIVNTRTGHLVDGHLRCQVAARNGDKTIPVVYVDLSEEEEALILATIDPLAAMAATDKAKLDELLHAVQSDDERVQGMLQEIADKEHIQYGAQPPEDVEPQIDKAEELRVKWGVELGQLWKLGEHRIICGDCTDRVVVDRVMDGEKAGAVVTDPPYGLGKDKSFNDNHEDYDDEKPFDLTRLDLSLPFIVWGGNYYDWIPYARNKIGWVVWDKRPNLEGEKRERADRIFGQHFEIAITTIGGLRGKMLRHTWGGYYGDEEIVHKTQKPTRLFTDCVTETSGIVLDYFSGSGTTLIACEILHRKCRAIEISPGYVAVAIQRWVDVTGGTPELIEQINTIKTS